MTLSQTRPQRFLSLFTLKAGSHLACYDDFKPYDVFKRYDEYETRSTYFSGSH